VPYYTNSTHLPVGHTDDLFTALTLQDPLQERYTGGTVFHGFLGERLPDGDTVARLVKRITDRFRMPYFTITPTFAICSEHGYQRGSETSCASCGQPVEVYSRVAGYLRPVEQWNDGKKAEFADRVPYTQRTAIHA
jgi:ribonucleoside-triphosphate reductase